MNVGLLVRIYLLPCSSYQGRFHGCYEKVAGCWRFVAEVSNDVTVTCHVLHSNAIVLT